MRSLRKATLVVGALCVTTLAVATPFGQERFEVLPMDKGKALGVATYRVERRDGGVSGNDYSIDIVDDAQSRLGTVTLQERFGDPSTAILADARSGARIQVRYTAGFQRLELKDLVSGVEGRSEFVVPGQGKPFFKKDAAFTEFERTRHDEFDQLFEAVAAVQSANARNLKERNERRPGVIRPIAWQSAYCQGGQCRGTAFSIARSFCCELARQSASNCCGMNSYCIGCCRFGACDAYCSFGDYACPVCGMTGTTCSGPH